MENKYFTPDIEDLCIGYECEYNFARAYTDEFDFVKIGYKNVTPGKGGYTNELTDMIHLIDDGAAAIRVPFLTKEQIQAEGWTKEKSYFIKNNIYLFFEDGMLVIDSGNPFSWEASDSEILFKGKCKDINTFRKICKLLEI